MANIFLRVGSDLSMSLVGGRCLRQNSRVVCNSAFSRAGLTTCSGAARSLAGGLAPSLEALGQGQRGKGGLTPLVAMTALSLHLQQPFTAPRTTHQHNKSPKCLMTLAVLLLR